MDAEILVKLCIAMIETHDYYWDEKTVDTDLGDRIDDIRDHLLIPFPCRDSVEDDDPNPGELQPAPSVKAGPKRTVETDANGNTVMRYNGRALPNGGFRV